MLKLLQLFSNVCYITCHHFYLILISFRTCLRRITEPLWRLTFWAFHLGRCDVTRPLPPAPTVAQNAHRPNLDHDILLSGLTNNTTTYSRQTYPPKSYIDMHTLIYIYKVNSRTLLKRIQFTKLTHANIDGRQNTTIRVRSSVITVISTLGRY